MNYKKVGRPKGYKVSEESKQKMSYSMKYYYEHMTDKQKQVREECNKNKSIVYQKAMQLYYDHLKNNE